jgi:hypothetical protein
MHVGALLGHPEPAVSWHGGFRGGAHARPKATPVPYAARRRGGRVAAGGARSRILICPRVYRTSPACCKAWASTETVFLRTPSICERNSCVRVKVARILRLQKPAAKPTSYRMERVAGSILPRLHQEYRLIAVDQVPQMRRARPPSERFCSDRGRTSGHPKLAFSASLGCCSAQC